MKRDSWNWQPFAVIPGRAHKRVYARLRRAMAREPGIQMVSDCSGFRVRLLRNRPGMTEGYLMNWLLYSSSTGVFFWMKPLAR